MSVNSRPTTEGKDLLTQILADARGEASVIGRTGNTQLAEYITELCDKIADATEDYRTFLSEPDARLRSGWSVARLRRHFAEWAEEGHAETRNRVRYYRALILPRRPDIAAARDAGRRGVAA